MAVAGVCIAFTDPLLEPSPSWTRLDTTDNLVARYSIQRGRTDELERTPTGTATVEFNDTQGLLDPTNVSSPYWGLVDGKQAAIGLWNPVTSAWTTVFRGFIEGYDVTVDPSQVTSRVSLGLVDALDYLAGVEMTTYPAFGNALPADVDAGNIYYGDTTRSRVGVVFKVRDRIEAALADAGWPTALQTIFSGNVTVQDTVYAPRSTTLQAIEDAADAEFAGGVANIYVSKDGKITFHGRLADFEPDVVAARAGASWNYTVWKAGDGAAILADSSTAQIRELSFSRSRKGIVNSASATAQGIADSAIAAQLVEDTTSQGLYGVRSWSAENLLTATGLLTGNQPEAETKLFATYMVDNYKEPRTRVNRISFKSIAPSDTRAAATWDLICGIEISDTISLTTSHPGGGGFSEDFRVQGLTYDVEPLNPDYPLVTLTVDVSPVPYYGLAFT